MLRLRFLFCACLCRQAEVHLSDAERKWPDEVLVELHRAELLVHQMEYGNAVQLLRRTSRKLDIEIGDDTSGSSIHPKVVIMRHLAPTVAALHGVAEFRIDPENPDVSTRGHISGTTPVILYLYYREHYPYCNEV